MRFASQTGISNWFYSGQGYPGPDPPRTLPRPVDLTSQASFMVTGDLNGDGRDDILVLSNSDSRLLLFLQASGGTLPSRPTHRISTGFGLVSAAIGDVNGDGFNDLVVANGNASTLSVFYAR